jgi:predicted P-loop ATPase
MADISVFDSIDSIESPESIPLTLYLHEVQSGRWQDQVLQVRAISDKKRRDTVKKSLPGVTFSGLFSKRKDDCLIQHSGFICIDIDDLDEDVEAFKEILIKDRYVYSCFTSVSGTGLRVLFRIASQHHRESYYGISDYLRKHYGLITDPQSMVPSRSFYITYDPFLYLASGVVPVFTDYPKEIKHQKTENFAFAEDDFFNILNQIETKRINLCDSYQDWLKIGFALSNKFGENGRDYYHIVSSMSEKYNIRQCDKQYTYCIRHKAMNVATIATFYWYCKQAGLQITSERTQKIRKITVTGKSAGLRKEQIVENLKKFENIQGEDVPKIVADIFETSTGISQDDNLIDQLEAYLNNNYIFKRDEISKAIEKFPGRQRIDQVEFNSIWKSAKRVLKLVDYQLFDRVMNSNFIPNYNPLWDYFQELGGEWKNPVLPHFAVENQVFETPLLDAFASTIINDNPAHTAYFIKKWVVSIVASAFKSHSPLVLILTGRQNTGKTEWFRRLLPKELREPVDYYAESKLEKDKDDELLMCSKLIIMDDEFGGKGKNEYEKFKTLTSKQIFSIRPPYGRMSVDYMRLAVLAGTSNFSEVLSDPTGNRRIIPISVGDTNKNLYNSINKRDLFKEAYEILNNGFDWRIISKSDVEYLNHNSEKYQTISEESELIEKLYIPSEEDLWLTATEIKIELDYIAQRSRLTVDKVGKQLRKLGFPQRSFYNSDTKNSTRKWGVKKRPGEGSPNHNSVNPVYIPPDTDKSIPF